MLATAILAATLATAPVAGPAAKTDPAAVARLRAEAQGVIRAASAQAHFSDDTRWDLPAVRHKASGMRCLFQPNDRNNEIIFIGAVQGGGGMGCLSRPSGFTQRLEAVRLGSGETLDTLLTGSSLNITFQRPEARPYDGALSEIRIEPATGAPPAAEIRSARYVIRKDGREVFSRVSVAIVGDWVVRQYFEAPADRAEEADMLAGVVMSTTLIDLAERSAAGA